MAEFTPIMNEHDISTSPPISNAAIQIDLKTIFFLESPYIFFSFVELCLFLQCVSFSVYLVQALPLATEVGGKVGILWVRLYIGIYYIYIVFFFPFFFFFNFPFQYDINFIVIILLYD